MNLFPILDLPEPGGAGKLPVFRDIAWNFERDEPQFGPDREPVWAEGLEALKGWALNAIRTERYRFERYTFDYGCELERLVGRKYAKDTTLSEAARYVREALEVNPYITGVTVGGVALKDSVLTMDVTVSTIYGEVEIHV